MRRRTTFFHDPQLDIDPSQLQLSGSRFFITNLDAAREERLTVGLKELPRELVHVLERAHELHLHWATESNYNTSTPLFSRISPGLHISYTPLKEQQEDELCPLLHKILAKDLKCLSVKETFTTPSLISSRFAATPSFQYHSQLSSLSRLIAYLQTQICPHSDPDAEQACIHTTSLLSLVSTLSISYDSISHALVLTTTWATPPPVYLDPVTGDIYYDSWQAKIDTTTASKVEVGILTASQATDPHELALSGVLTRLCSPFRPVTTHLVNLTPSPLTPLQAFTRRCACPSRIPHRSPHHSQSQQTVNAPYMRTSRFLLSCSQTHTNSPLPTCSSCLLTIW